MTRAVFRFAPSPNGYLHLGHALSALLNQEMARACGGRLLVRIEDVDGTRARPEFEAAILEDLDWLGIAYERPVRRQSDHLDDYRSALARLDAAGLLYAARLSRSDIQAAIRSAEAASGQAWPRDPDGAPLYPGGPFEAARTEEPPALRLRMTAAAARAFELHGILTWEERGEGRAATVTADPAAWGDVMLAGKYTAASYHLAVVVDDAIQGVTDVVRGRDLYHATSVHRLLQVLLGLPAPRYHHHGLVLGADGRKLSKSERATALRALRADGWTPEDVRRRVGLLP